MSGNNVGKEKFVVINNGQRTHSGVLSEADAQKEADRVRKLTESTGSQAPKPQVKQILEG